MILSSWSALIYTSKGKIHKSSLLKKYRNTIECDECKKIFDEPYDNTEDSIKKYGKSLCGKCRTPLGLSYAGKMSHLKSPNNKGRFSSERWNALTPEQQKIQVTRASDALQEKLNNDPVYREKHFKKVFQNSKIGFISKGHNELHEFLKECGFVQHFIISDMEVDECHIDYKIVVEYNGDLYHCNPRKWKPDQYNTAIKMCASEKWEKDRKRMWKLQRLGYRVFVVWEEDWYNKQDYIKQRLISFIESRKDEIDKN